MIVEFKDKANLKPAAAVKDRSKRGQAVIDALTVDRRRRRSARPTATAARLRGVDAKTYWLTNVMVVEGDSRDAVQARHDAGQGPGRRADPS